MPAQDFVVSFGSNIASFNAGLLLELEKTSKIVADFDAALGKIGKGSTSPPAVAQGAAGKSKSGSASTASPVIDPNELRRAMETFSTELTAIVRHIRGEATGQLGVRNAPTGTAASIAETPKVMIDDAAFTRVVESVERNVAATVRVELAIDRLIDRIAARNDKAPERGPEVKKKQGEDTAAANARTQRTQEQYNALNPTYRARLERSGITAESYIAGAPLSAARGHSVLDAVGANGGRPPGTPGTPGTGTGDGGHLGGNSNEILQKILTAITTFHATVKSRRPGKATTNTPEKDAVAAANSPAAQTARKASAAKSAAATQFGASAEEVSLYFDALARTRPELAGIINMEDKLAAAVRLVTAGVANQAQALDLFGNALGRTRTEAAAKLSGAVRSERVLNAGASLEQQNEDALRAIEAQRVAESAKRPMLGPAAPTVAERRQMERADSAAAQASRQFVGPLPATSAEFRAMAAEQERQARVTRDQVRNQAAYRAVLAGVSAETKAAVANLERLVRAGASDEQIAHAQAEAYRQLNNELRSQGVLRAPDRNPLLAQVFSGAGTPVTGPQLNNIRTSAARLPEVVPADTAGEAGREGKKVGEAMGTGARTGFASIFGDKGFFGRVLNTTGTFIVRQLSATAVFGLAAALHTAISQGLDTESTFVRVSSALEATGRSTDGLRTRLQGLSQQYGVTLQDVYTTTAGLTGLFDKSDTNNDALVNLTKVALQLEIISGGALNSTEAMRSLASVTAAYGKESATNIADVATVIQNQLGVNVENTIEGVARLSGQAKVMGISFQNAATYVASISKLTGQSGEAAGEQFSRILESLQTGKTQRIVQKALDSKGVDIGGLLGSSDYQGVLNQLLKSYDKLDSAQKSRVSTALGGSRQAAAVNALLSDGAKVLDTASKAQYANGDAQERAIAISKQLQNELKRGRAAFVNFFEVLIRSGALNALGLVLKDVVWALDMLNKGLSTLNDFFDSSPLLTAIRTIATTVGGLAISFTLLTKAVRGFAAAAGGMGIIQRFAAGAGGVKTATAAEGALATNTAANAAAAAPLAAGLFANRRNNPMNYYNPLTARAASRLAPEAEAAARTFAVGAGGEAVLLGNAATVIPRGRMAQFLTRRQASVGAMSVNLSDRADAAIAQRAALQEQAAARAATGLRTVGTAGAELRAGATVASYASAARGTAALSTGLGALAAGATMLNPILLAVAVTFGTLYAGARSFSEIADEYDKLYSQTFGKKVSSNPDNRQDVAQANAYSDLLAKNADQNKGFTGLLRGIESNVMHPFTGSDELTARNVGRLSPDDELGFDKIATATQARLARFSMDLKKADPKAIAKAIAANQKDIQTYADEINSSGLSKAQKINLMAKVSALQTRLNTSGQDYQLAAEGLRHIDALTSDQIANVGNVITTLAGLGNSITKNFTGIITGYLGEYGLDSNGETGKLLKILAQGYTAKTRVTGRTTTVQAPASTPNLTPGKGSSAAGPGSLAPFPTDAHGNIIPTDAQGKPVFPSINPHDKPGTPMPIAPTVTTHTTTETTKTPLTYEKRQDVSLAALRAASSAANAAVLADTKDSEKRSQDIANAITLSSQLSQAVAQHLQEQVDAAAGKVSHLERSGNFSGAAAAAQKELAQITKLHGEGHMSAAAFQQQSDQIQDTIANERASAASAQYDEAKLHTRNVAALARLEVQSATAALNALEASHASHAVILAAQQRQQQAINAQQDQQIAFAEASQSYSEYINTPELDTVGAALNAIKDDRQRLRDLASTTGKQTADYVNAEKQLAADERNYQNSLSDVVESQYSLAIAIADAGGHTVQAARLALQDSRRKLAEALRKSGGNPNTPGAKAAAADEVTKAAAYRDSVLQNRENDIDFNQQMANISTAAAIQQYQALLKMKGLTKAERQQIMLKIHGLQQGLISELTSSGFNIPGEVKLPTPYQVRRSLGVDKLQNVVKTSFDDVAAANKAVAAGGTGVNSSRDNALVSAMNQVRDAVHAKGAQHVSVKQDNNFHVPTAHIAAQIANQVIAIINQQNGQQVRANTSTPRIVSTR